MTRQTTAGLAALACSATFAAGAPAAGTSVSLKAGGDYGRATRSVCGKRQHFRLFHRGATIEFKGFVTPAPAKHFPFTVEVKRCSSGRFRIFHTYAGTGKKATGKYKLFLRAGGLAPRSRRRGAIVYYFARTRMGAGTSRNEYFAVTR